MKSLRINRHVYDVHVNENAQEVTLLPRTGGSPASSNLDTNSYAYTHGGKIFIAAVDKAKEIAETEFNL